MTEPGKAVFLSYASQDAEAASRICEALRAADIEVWFDQSELRGGMSGIRRSAARFAIAHFSFQSYRRTRKRVRKATSASNGASPISART